MIVFDASGSMWAQVEGKAKIEIAKDTLKTLIDDWDENKQIGLLAYGHRVKGDCKDIEILVPVGRVNKESMFSIIDKINPKGKTPISAALTDAADQLKFTEDNATVILISDGKETCDADPCRTAAELEKLGINFTAHVIGFDVGKETGKQLECVATSTGGQYFPANNAKQLNEALKKASKQADTLTFKTVAKNIAHNNSNKKKIFNKKLLVIKAKATEKTIIDGIVTLSTESNTNYELDATLSVEKDTLTLELLPTVKSFSDDLNTLPFPIPINRKIEYTLKGKIVNIENYKNTNRFNFTTKGIFSFGNFLLPISAYDLKIGQKLPPDTLISSVLITPSEVEIRVDDITDSEILVSFSTRKVSEDRDFNNSVSGNATYDRDTLFIIAADINEQLKMTTIAKRNGKEVKILTDRKSTFIVSRKP